MTLRFAMVCEAVADFRTASGLADRVVCDAVEWISDEVLDAYRSWYGLNDTLPFLSWTRAAALAKKAGFRVHGHFDGAPGQPDAQAARRALWLLRTKVKRLDGVVMIRDDDRQTNRRQGLEQARNESSLHCPIVIGLAHVQRECWILAGFEPATAEEQQRLSILTKELSFDPRMESQRLTGRRNEERSAKRVLELLTGADLDREAMCWRATPLVLLVTRGQGTGLAAYLEEVRSMLVPPFRDSTRG